MSTEGPVIDTVFFDLDGTLLDTTYLHTLAWWRALDDAGERRPMAAIHRLIGMGSSELLTTLLGHDDDQISQAHGKYFADLHPFIRPLPDAAKVVRRAASDKSKVVVVTSAKERDLTALLGQLGCDDVIDEVVHGEEAERAKPSPDLFCLALERVGVEPQHVLALGDAVWDVKAAAKAGIACVAVETGGIDRRLLEEAGAVAVYATCTQLLLDGWDALSRFGGGGGGYRDVKEVRQGGNR